MEDSDDNVTFGERRAILQLEVQLDEDKPLFSAEDRRPDKAAVQCPEIQEAALLLALNENPGDRLASNKRTRLHDLFLQLSDAERALFLQEVNGQPSTKSKKSKKSEAHSKTKPESNCEEKNKAPACRARPHPYTDAIRTRALEFIAGRRESGRHTTYEAAHYMAALLHAWPSWPGGHPPPGATQVQRWIRDAKAKCITIKTYEAAVIKWKIEFNAKGEAVSSALSCLVCGIVSLLHREHKHEKILLLAQVNKSTCNQLLQLSEYETAKALAVMQQPDLDTQLLLQQFALSKNGAVGYPNGAVEYTPIEFVFSESQHQRKYQEAQLTADHRLSLQNILKEPSPFMEGEKHQVEYVGNGTFGIVLAIGSVKNGVALKISKDLQEMDTIPATSCNEMAMHMINDRLHKSTTRASLRADLPQPFGPLPVSEDRQCGPWQKYSCCAMPSILNPGLGYAVLVTRRALGNMEKETEDISRNCFSNINVDNDGLIRASSLALGVLSGIESMHSLNLVHRDIKPSNTLFYASKSGTLNHHHTDASGRSVICVLTDFGKSYTFKSKILTGTASGAAMTTPRARKIASMHGISFEERLTMATELGREIAVEMSDLQRRPAETVWEVSKQYYPVSIGRDDGLREVQIRSVHVINPCFPSSGRVDTHIKSADPPPPMQKQTGWGTSAFAPPEPHPSLREGMEYLEAVDFQSGDMYALGIWLAEMLAGNGLKLGLTTGPGCNEGTRALKSIFADCADTVFWSRFLGKQLINGAIPEEYHDFVDFIRRLTRLNPQERISAKDALKHPFIALAARVVSLGAIKSTGSGRRIAKHRKL